jgi:predicted membrane protein
LRDTAKGYQQIVFLDDGRFGSINVMVRIKVSFLCFFAAGLSFIDIFTSPTRPQTISALEAVVFWAILGIGFKTRQIYWQRAN